MVLVLGSITASTWSSTAAQDEVAAEEVLSVQPEASRILQRALEAMGGADARDQIESTRASAKISIGATGSSYEILTRRPGAFLVRQEIKGLGDMEIGCDGTTAWRSDPPDGRLTPMPIKQAAEALRSFDFQALLREMDRRFPGASLGEPKEIEGILCDHVELTDGSNRISAFFDQRTGLLRAFDVKAVESRPMLRRVTIEKWSEPGTSEFLWAKRLRIKQPGGTLEAEYRSVTFNDVAESNFELPVGITPNPAPEPEATPSSSETSSPSDSERTSKPGADTTS
jgi:hypothetical protein